MKGSSRAASPHPLHKHLLCSTAACALIVLPAQARAQSGPPAPAAAPTSPPATNSTPPGTEPSVADATATAPTSPVPAAEPATGSDIVVTGTSIRGAAPVGSNLISLGRAAIDTTGAANSAELLSTIPQLNSFNMIPESQVLRSRTQGYALNIHNLGYYATLTLINGHRYAPGGGEVTFVDPAMIPSIAIERVELVPDGASGIYGSDAVAGVVNFVYRRPFTGIEGNLQYGFGAGSLESKQAAVIAGKKWNSGSVSLAFEYSQRVPPTVGELGLKGDNRDQPVYPRDSRSTNCSPGNATVNGVVYALPNFTTPRNMCEANPTQQLYPRGTRYTALLQARKTLSDAAEVYLEGTYGHYSSVQETGYVTIGPVTVPITNPYFQRPAGSAATSVTVVRNSAGLFPNRTNLGGEKEFGVTVGLDYKLSDAWQLNVFAHGSQDKNFSTVGSINPVTSQTLANNTTFATAFNPFGNASANNPAVLAQIDDGYYTRNIAKNRLVEVQAKADGPVFALPGGDVKAAVGLDYRYEDVSQIQDYGTNSSNSIVRDSFRDRHVYAAFGELNVPVFGPDNAMTLVRSLQLALSARYDRYSGLKGIANPKVGVSWKPINDLTIQGSWGKSFVAPNLGALGGSYLIPFVQQNQTAVGLGIINLIHVAGGNSNLTPEYAHTWSAGAKYAPSYIPGLHFGISYFHVNYRDTQYQPQEGLSSPAFADFLRAKFPPGVNLHVTPADVAALLTVYKFQGLYPPDTVWTTITTSALVNAGVLRARGIDFDLAYGLRTPIGRFDAVVNGTHMVKYLFQLLPTITPVDQLDTDRAPRWKVRSSVNWAYSAVSANFTWNYISSYRNFSVVPNERVKQFNTFDVRFGYTVPVGQGVELSLRAQNVFNKKAPYYAAALGYDGAAASPLGREWQVGTRFRF